MISGKPTRIVWTLTGPMNRMWEAEEKLFGETWSYAIEPHDEDDEPEESYVELEMPRDAERVPDLLRLVGAVADDARLQVVVVFPEGKTVASLPPGRWDDYLVYSDKVTAELDARIRRAAALLHGRDKGE